jgi:hypothetical protein
MKNEEKYPFWAAWTGRHAWAIPSAYLASMVIILILAAFFGIRSTEFGAPWKQLVMQLFAGAILGAGTAWVQRGLLQRFVPAGRAWIWLSAAGFALGEAIAWTICAVQGIDRMQLRFLERNALPEAAIFAGCGLFAGILQYFVLRKYVRHGALWIPANTIGWGLIPLLMAYPMILPEINSTTLSILLQLAVFFLGSAIYGALTGATLAYGMKRIKKIN